LPRQHIPAQNAECSTCGIVFFCVPGRINAKGEKYCSPECQHKVKSQQSQVDFVCDQCQHLFPAYPSQRPKLLKFCCRECGFEYQRTGKLKQADVEKPILNGQRGKRKNMTVILENGELKNK
jgi:hypothetical protein